MSKRMQYRVVGGAVMAMGAVLFAVCLCGAVKLAHAQSTPASQVVPVAPAGTDLSPVVTTLIAAFGNHAWPVAVMALLVLALGYERHWVGLTGPRVSTWLGSHKALTSLAMAVATAGLAVATQGWRAIGSGCLVALVIGAANAGVQLVGPAAVLPGAVPLAQAQASAQALPATVPPAP